jgi:hypothetical protein
MKTCKHDGCNNPVFSHSFCRSHQWCRQDDKRPVASTSIHSKKERHIKPKKGITGELELFKQIWAEREHVSYVSGVKIPVFDIKSFHHVCTKQAFPELRLVKENIVLLTRAEHANAHAHTFDDLIKRNSNWSKVKELHDALKSGNYEKE